MHGSMGEYSAFSSLSLTLLLHNLYKLHCTLIKTVFVFLMKDAYETLGKVDSSKMSWRLRVRVTRSWPFKSLRGDKIIAHNLILLDNDVCLPKFVCS